MIVTLWSGWWDEEVDLLCSGLLPTMPFLLVSSPMTTLFLFTGCAWGCDAALSWQKSSVLITHRLQCIKVGLSLSVSQWNVNRWVFLSGEIIIKVLTVIKKKFKKILLKSSVFDPYNEFFFSVLFLICWVSYPYNGFFFSAKRFYFWSAECPIHISSFNRLHSCFKKSMSFCLHQGEFSCFPDQVNIVLSKVLTEIASVFEATWKLCCAKDVWWIISQTGWKSCCLSVCVCAH